MHYEALSDEEEKLTENTVDSRLQDTIKSQTAESPTTQGRHVQKNVNNLQTDCNLGAFHVKAICKWCWTWLLPMIYNVLLAHYQSEQELVWILLIAFESENLKEMGQSIEGLHAKRAYTCRFLADVHFLQDQANFSQPDLF